MNMKATDIVNKVELDVTYDSLIEQIMEKPIEEMQELYNTREIEK